MRLGIRYQLLLPPLMLLLGVGAVSTWTALASADRARRRIERQMGDIVDTANAVTIPRNVQTLRLMKGLSGAGFLICDPRGEPLRDSQGEPVTTLPDVPLQLPEPKSDGDQAELGSPVEVAGETYFCRGVQLGRSKWTLYIFYPESLWRDALWHAIGPSLFLGATFGLGSIFFAIVMAQRLSRRIRELEQRTRSIARGDFSPMPVPNRNDELRDLSLSVNEMAAQLSEWQRTIEQNERLRLLAQVSGGLAHQLRNGVTGARLAMQLHARELDDGDESESLQVALRQLALIDMYLKRFFELGRSSDIRREPVCLVDLIDETIALVIPQCRHAGTQLEWERPKSASTILGDREQLQHLLLNIITNAIEAAGPGGWVRVGVSNEKASDSVLVRVIDSGPGPAPDVAARLFEPFVTGKREGVGLGLAVSRQVVENHDGSICWRRETESTCFEVRLPATELAPTTAVTGGKEE